MERVLNCRYGEDHGCIFNVSGKTTENESTQTGKLDCSQVEGYMTVRV